MFFVHLKLISILRHQNQMGFNDSSQIFFYSLLCTQLIFLTNIFNNSFTVDGAKS